ncbi:MAG TPA: DNA modification methylase [Candidatus Saccharibacteria bacterium]|nr:DNA modification methylase [Candidatus Saccharibacteria bacterium]
MSLEQKNIEDLKANPKNPRTMQKHDAESLRVGMKEFGDLAPIVFNVQTGQLVGGHQRINVLTKMMSGQKQVIITQRFETPDQVGTVALGYVVHENRQFAYREVDWPLGKELAANIAANRVQGEFQLDMLAEVINDISQMEDSANLLAMSGQTEDEINRMLDMSGASGERNPAEDEAPGVDNQNPPVSKVGEIYQLGRHRLMCGDSTDFGAVSDLMDGKQADMVFTDPPYGMNLDTDYAKRPLSEASAEKHSSQNSYERIIGDDRPYDPSHIFEMFADTKEIFLWGGDYYAKRLPENGSWFVWDKRKGMEDLKYTNASFELCWSKKSHAREIVRVAWFGLIGTEQQDVRQRIHPTQKPLEVCDFFIKQFSERKQVIVDLFGGSGTTLISCDKLDRTCYMMELSPAYADVIRKRYHKHVTGSEEGWQEATKAINEVEHASTTTDPIPAES